MRGASVLASHAWFTTMASRSSTASNLCAGDRL